MNLNGIDGPVQTRSPKRGLLHGGCYMAGMWGGHNSIRVLWYAWLSNSGQQPISQLSEVGYVYAVLADPSLDRAVLEAQGVEKGFDSRNAG